MSFLLLQDYRGPDVTADNFLSVLAGAEPAVIGSSGKVIKSGPDDRVFVFYADHGAPGTSCEATSCVITC